ncbi:MAG: sugar ABC transporter ATP-binding protein [Planctomycetota bacterium]|jgi:ribose transport system ATP-binding protein
MAYANILSVKNITKTYPGVKALDDVSIDVRKGEVHALVGENGAGKSTLVNILTGAVKPDSGQLELDGIVYSSLTVHQAIELGITAIYQEFNLVGFLSAAENVFFGNEIRRGPFVCSGKMNAETAKLFSALGVEMDPASLVKDLSASYQQIVEIAKAMSRDVRILIMDEPSASLTANEVEHLFGLVETLKEKGVTIIYISHKMSEVFELADRITVLRDGKFITTLDSDMTNRSQLVGLMVGKELGESYPQKDKPEEDVLLEVRNLSTTGFLNDISFTLRRGEILGFAGLVGAGRTELARAIFGADPIQSGQVLIEGKKISVNNPARALVNGIGYVPENRKEHGILGHMSVKENVSFSSMKNLSLFGLVKDKKEKELIESFSEKLNIKAPDLNAPVGNLSGGNQQKVVLSRWLGAGCKILLFDEPTRGIDVGAKQEIYEIITRLAREGTGIIFISSETPELIGLADRILVFRAGSIVGAFQKGEATQEAVLDLAMTE